MPKKELKPPPIEGSEDMTAPASYVVGAEMGHDVPRTIRNRIVHEHFHKVPVEEGEGDGQGGMTKAELKEHRKEVHAMHQETKEVYDRDHPGIGKAGKGDNAVNSQATFLGAPDERTRFGHQ